MSAAPVLDTAARRCAAVLAAGGMLLPLAACTSGDDSARGDSGAARDMRVVSRDDVSEGGTLRWAIEEMPTTLNVFQPDASGATTRIAEATLPALFTLDSRGRPQVNHDYLVSAEITDTEPRQTVVYTLDPDAEWSGGRAISVADFRAQFQALNGHNSAYWTARNAGYDRIAEVEKGEEAHQVKVTFKKPYADWEALFTPLYPKSVMGSPDAFNEQARTKLPASGGPFRVEKIDPKKDDAVTLVRNDAWWGDEARLARIALTVVPRGERRQALATGKIDLADVSPRLATRIDGVHAADAKPGEKEAREDAAAKKAGQKKAAAKKIGELGAYDVKRALAPAYTQLALNGASGPLADERVRRALARALDRDALAEQALAGLGLPAQALGSHLRMRDQAGYQDNSDALGGRDVESAQALLADAGWLSGAVPGRDGDAPVDAKEAERKKDGKNKEKKDGAEEDGEATDDKPPARGAQGAPAAVPGGTGLLVSAAEAARITSVPLSLAPYTAAQRAGVLGQAARAAAGDEEKKNGERAEKARQAAEKARQRADEMNALNTGRAAAVRTKDGRPLALRFLVPAGPGTDVTQQTAENIAEQLDEIGIRTRIERIKDESWFRDHIASGDFDLALYSWPASAFPATDAGPIFAKPVPAANGSLTVQQNYTRVGTDRIDQLFAEAVGELDAEEREELLARADSRIWAAAGSVPLYQRPQLVAVREGLANAGAFGFQTPRYQDIGWVR